MGFTHVYLPMLLKHRESQICQLGIPESGQREHALIYATKPLRTIRSTWFSAPAVINSTQLHTATSVPMHSAYGPATPQKWWRDPTSANEAQSAANNLAIPDQLRDGDVVTVTKYDRLARSLKDLLEIVEIIGGRGAGFRSLAEDIDTTTPAGRLVFHVFASIAQFERERISERTKEGLASARKRGRIGGRPPALSAVQRDEVRRMRDEEHRAIPEIARLFKVSERTVRRA